MKKLLTFLTLLTLFFSVTWAETATLPGTQALTTSFAYVGTDTHIKIKTSDANSYTNPIRIYANNTVTIAADDGYVLKSVKYEASSTGNYVTYAQNATVSPNVTPTVSGKYVTWTFTTNPTEFTFTPSSQTRCSSMVITYEKQATDPPTPPTAEIIFNPTTNSTIEIGSTVNFTLNGTATGIKYTTDNTNPGANNGTIGSSVTLNGNAGDQITIKAVAFNQNSAGTAYGTIYTATYTLKTSTSKTYQRITSTDDLEIGEKYIIIYSTSATNINAYVLGSNNPSGTTRPFVTKDISEDRKITVGPNDAIAQFTLGGGPDAYTLLCDNGSYLNGQSSSQYLKINGDGTDNYSKWNITFDGNYAKINNKGNTSYYVSWHTNQHYFNLYTSYTGIYLYKEYIPKAYNVAVTQPAEGGNISASPEGENVVDAGDKVTVTATPADGYELSSWTITGASESEPDANNQITATGNVTITATFSKIQYSITNVVKTNGEVNGAGGTLTNWTGVSTVGEVWGAKMGDEISFRADTYNGYQIREENISITDASGNAVTFTFNNNVVTFTMPASNVTITANYTYYRPKIRLAGRYNTTNSSAWVNTNVGPQFVYDSDNDRYTLDVFFATPSSNFFYLFVDENATWPTSGGNWSVTNTTGTATAVSWNGGDGNEFAIAPGIFTITIAGDMSTISFKAIEPTVSLTPDGSSNVEAGSSVTVSSNLTTLLDGIVSGTTATLATSTDNTNYTDGATYTMPLTAGSVTLYGKAYYGAIVVTTPATIYTVVKANTSNKYQLVSDINSMESGKKYLIVSKGNYTSYGNTYNYEVAATGISGTVLGGEDIDIVDNIITLSSNSNVVPYVMNLSSGKWSFMNSNTNEYLTFTDPSSGSGTVSTGSTGTAFTLNSINSTSGNADLALSNSKLYFNPNSGNYRFSTYKNAQKSVMLFKQMVEEVKDYTITYAEVTGGSATGATEANEGEQITVTVTANDGYAATGITVNPSVEVTDNHDGTYTFTMPASNVTVTPTFVAAYPITYVAEPAAGGLVTGVASAIEGSTVVINVTPNADYQISSVVYSWGTAQSAVNVPIVDGNYQITMPGSATTVTATFVKIPHGITVVSSHGDVTGIPATATSGTSVTFTVTPNAGYVVSSVTGTFNGGNSSLNITDNGDGTYTFNMPASDVAITVTYFASEDYELLTDLADINEEDTYLIVGGPVAGGYVNVMGKKTDNSTMGYTALTLSNYDSETGIITSNENMAVVNFLVSNGTYAIHTAEGYVNESSVTASAPFYWTIELDETTSRAQITSDNKHFSYNSSAPRWKAYNGEQGASYIFKLANKNKVKRPTITGAAGEFLGQYNFIGKDNVSMACATEDAVIEYSLDGGNTWQSYSEAFEISTDAAGNTVDVMALATKTGMEPSDAVTATFTCIKPTAPTFGTNEAGAYVNPVFVYPKSALKDRRAYGEESVSFCYTTDGTDADASSPAVATSNSNGYYIVLDDNATLSVVTVINDIASDPAGGAYTFNVDAPTFSLAGGNYDGNQQTRLSTGTKTQQNNLSWNTVIYYTTGNTEFAFNATTGEVTSEGWIAYDPTNSPYIDILAANGTTTIKAVTLSNYFNGQSEYRASDVTTETYVLTAANLSITISPAAGTYVNAQNVTLGVKNNIGDYIIYYTTDGSDPNTNGTEYTGTPITVDHDMTIKVYAVDSRTGDGGTATAEAVYKIGIQPVVYSPFPGTIYKGDDEDINVEMFSVTP
ncbi:MAG: chitobiase/beta-hexosaminidase C-terminal domain-containing protein, partial [Muribaculaceae bacterium]|nr:chitobiase/beta-hexosaminidase C-terminal domain-containing protein [Muribaculaceae bacterium]